MPTLIEQLSIEKREIAHRVIVDLRATMPQVLEYERTLNEIKSRLISVDSFEDFYATVRHAMLQGKEPHQLYLNVIEGMDNEIYYAVQEICQTDEELTKIHEILHFGQALENTILGTKERLTLREAYTDLTEDERVIADKFIVSLKKVQEMVVSLTSDKIAFQERLKHVSSSAEIDQIEVEIENYDAKILELYDNIVPFPEDENIAGALIGFLEKNSHLRNGMQVFDFHEALVDDIMAARAQVGVIVGSRI
jgi:hypothetical protein